MGCCGHMGSELADERFSSLSLLLSLQLDFQINLKKYKVEAYGYDISMSQI